MKKIIQNIILLVAGIIIGIMYRVPWNSIVKCIGKQNWGSIAEWAGAVGSVLAIFAGFHQVKKQNNFNRALKTEECRPKFECHFISTTGGKNAIILTYDAGIELSSVDFMLKNSGDRKIVCVRMNNSLN